MIKNFLELGKIVGTHGIKGELKVNPMCDSPDFAKQFKTVYKDNTGNNPIKVVSCRTHGNLILMKFADVDTIDMAEKLRGTVLYIKREDAGLDDSQWFIEELKGCRIFDINTNKYYGILTDVMTLPANDVWTVTDDKGSEYLLPAVKNVVASVNVSEEIIKISPMKGIFDEPVSEEDL